MAATTTTTTNTNTNTNTTTTSVSSRRTKKNASGRTGRVSVLEKLEDRISAGDHYGALQMYKTLYSRHVNALEFTKATSMALAALNGLIKYKQVSEATEMGLLLIESFYFPDSAGGKGSAKTVVAPAPPASSSCLVSLRDGKVMIKEINEAYETQECIGLELAKVLKAAVVWTSKKGDRKRGDPEIQLLVAKAYEKAADYVSASKHYLHAEKPVDFSNMLIDWANLGMNSERDLFLARAVLQLLCVENLRDANIVYTTFLENTRLTGKAFDTPLVHFLRFLLLTVERDALPLFQMLQQRYAPSLQRDDSFMHYMVVIGEKYFGLKPRQTGIGALMGMLGGGLQ